MPDAHPCPAMLWTLLLLLATLLCAHGGRWDTATCTEGVVSVPRGRRAEMGCRIANAFSHVTVLLCVHGNHCQTIFSEEGPGNFSQGGWHLRVQGGVAQLVIEDAQTSQAGMYKWRLAGLQRNVRFTTLNVSGTPRKSPSRPPAPTPGVPWAQPQALRGRIGVLSPARSKAPSQPPASPTWRWSGLGLWDLHLARAGSAVTRPGLLSGRAPGPRGRPGGERRHPRPHAGHGGAARPAPGPAGGHGALGLGGGGARGRRSPGALLAVVSRRPDARADVEAEFAEPRADGTPQQSPPGRAHPAECDKGL